MTTPALDARVLAAVGNKVPGVALVIVGPEGIRARTAIGVADVFTERPMSTGLAVPWFSMTKIATATTAVRLAEAGVLDLDVPLAPIVPPIQLLQPQGWAERITARHLLQHSAGIANPIPVRWIHPPGARSSGPVAFVEGLVTKHRKLRFEPGTRSGYSNLGTLLLGATITTLTGTRFERVVETEVLEPLSMSSTGFGFPAGVPAATGHHPRMSPLRLFLPAWVRGGSLGRWSALRPFLVDGAAYGGLVGTADDAARFLQLHLRAGELDGRRVISSESAQEMRTIDRRGKRYDLGLGWFVPSSQRDADPPFVEHLGGGAGFWNVTRMYPTLGAGAVVMGNSTKYDVDAVARLALSTDTDR